jgi:hypothetical protein
LQQLIGFFNYLLFDHNIAEILLKLALNTNQSINQSLVADQLDTTL